MLESTLKSTVKAAAALAFAVGISCGAHAARTVCVSEQTDNAVTLAFALRLLREKVVTGLIFHPTYSAALDVPAVNLAKQWIRAHGEDLWGV